MSTANHPQTDGQTERQNQTIGIAIRFAAADYPDVAWVDLLPAIQHNLNNAYAEAIGRSPNELVYGFKPNSTLNALIDTTTKDVPDWQEMRDLYQKEAMASIDWAATKVVSLAAFTAAWSHRAAQGGVSGPIDLVCTA
jgi:hypothetical protein